MADMNGAKRPAAKRKKPTYPKLRVTGGPEIMPDEPPPPGHRWRRMGVAELATKVRKILAASAPTDEDGDMNSTEACALALAVAVVDINKHLLSKSWKVTEQQGMARLLNLAAQAHEALEQRGVLGAVDDA